MRRLTLICVLLALTACTSTEGSTTSTTAAPATTPPQDSPTTTSTPTARESTIEPTAGSCFDDDAPFGTDGFLGRYDATTTDSETLSGISWTDSGECAVATFTFRSAEGAPAVDPPSVRAELLRHAGIVRLTFGGDAMSSVYSDQQIDTDLIHAAYVVWDPDADATVLDLHLGDASEARVKTEAGPARVIVELRASSAPFTGRAQEGSSAVVLPPPRDTSPLTIECYGPAGGSIDASTVTNGASASRTIEFEASPTRWTMGRWTLSELAPGPVTVTIGDAPAIEFTAR